MDKIIVLVNPKWLEKNLKAFNENIYNTYHLFDIDVILNTCVEDFKVIVEKEK